MNDYDYDQSMKSYFGEQYEIKQHPKNTITINSKQKEDTVINRLLADGNIDDMDILGEFLRRLTNSAWGDNWGTLTDSITEGEDPEKLPLPQITFDLVHRIPAENNPKPKLQHKIIHNGEHYDIYRQVFDATVEFNFYGYNHKQAKKLLKDFELLITLHTGDLKKYGISDIRFSEELPARESSQYRHSIPQRCITYMIKLERVYISKQSTLEEINVYSR